MGGLFTCPGALQALDVLFSKFYLSRLIEIIFGISHYLVHFFPFCFFVGWGRGQQYNWRLRTGMGWLCLKQKTAQNCCHWCKSIKSKIFSQSSCLIGLTHTPAEAKPYFHVLLLFAVAAEFQCCAEETQTLLLSSSISDIRFAGFVPLVGRVARSNFKVLSHRANVSIGDPELWYTIYCNIWKNLKNASTSVNSYFLF